MNVSMSKGENEATLNSVAHKEAPADADLLVCHGLRPKA